MDLTAAWAAVGLTAVTVEAGAGLVGFVLGGITDGTIHFDNC